VRAHVERHAARVQGELLDRERDTGERTRRQACADLGDRLFGQGLQDGV